jgi:hypothetical protein
MTLYSKLGQSLGIGTGGIYSAIPSSISGGNGITNESIIEQTYCPENLPYPLFAKEGGIPPFCLRPRAVSDPEGKGREGGIYSNV